MKRTFKTILCAAAVVMASVSCQKSAEPVQPAEEGKETIDICVNGLMGEYTQVDATKSELVNTVRVSWKAGDVVYVYDGAQCLGSLIASLDGTEDRYALLSTDDTHTVSAPASGTKLTLVHSPLLTEAPAVNDGAISISLASQSGEKAPFVAYATLDYTSTTITNAVVPFKFATSVIKVNCTGLKPGTAITSATLSNVNTACKLTLFGDKAPVVAGGTNGTITRTGDSYFAAGKINAEGEAVFQIAVPALEEASQARVLTVEQGSYKFKDKKFTTNSLAAATSVNTVCQLVGPPVGALPGVFSVSNDDGTNVTQILFSQGNLYYDGNKFNFETNQYDSTPSADDYWSTNHISHFFWSKTESVAYAESYSSTGTAVGDVFFTNKNETTAKASFTVNVNGKDQTGWRTLSTKELRYLFNKNNQYGETCRSGKYKHGVTVCGKENCVVLLPDSWEWDANTVGADWQMNMEDVIEYSEETPIKWSTMEDAGAVCLPAAGFRSDSYVRNVGYGGYYWSSTERDDESAYSVYFDFGKSRTDEHGDRNNGYSVRLITESK